MGEFGGGFVLGMIFMLLITLWSLSDLDTPTVESKVRIEPEWRLVTDGKVVDTLYVYKAK